MDAGPGIFHDDPATDNGELALGDSDFRFLRKFVLEHCGISLGEHKRQLVHGRLLRRLRALGLTQAGTTTQNPRGLPNLADRLWRSH